MIKRTVEISQQPVHVTVRDRQLVLLTRTDPSGEPAAACDPVPAKPIDAEPISRLRRHARPDQPLASIPCEDIGVLLVEHHGCTYSHAALTTLLDHDAAVVICGRNHLPAGLLLPLTHHTQVVWRVHDQLAAPRPLRKQLWRQIVQAKIRAQAQNLPRDGAARRRLTELARQVRSNDATNVEAQAARVYWAAWRDTLLPASDFRRDPDGPPPNNLLNYGYAIVRAAVARAIVAAGLLPALGLHHANRSNAFCLADDLVEPLRPIVDDRVRELVGHGLHNLTPPAKRGLLELLTASVRCAGHRGPLVVSLHRYVASLVRCLDGTARRLEIPVAADCGPESEAPEELADGIRLTPPPEA